MTEEPDIANQLILKLAKDIYKDAGSRPAKEVGGLAADLVKTLRLVLAPLQYTAALQDRFSNFLDKSVCRVPKRRRVAPAPQIAGPVLEAIRYEPENTPIDEMFSNLLSAAMDSEHVNEAHPAFPLLIRQLSSDEAMILARLRGKTYKYVYTLEQVNNRWQNPKIEVDELPKEGLRFPENLEFYIEHLFQMGLAARYENAAQQPIYAEDKKTQTGIRIFQEYRLMDVGTRLVHAAIKS